MQGEAWIELIKRIPDTHHDNLVAVTSTGAEIMVQRIMRLEKDFVILRGRPAGSTEEGRVLLLPWDQVNHVAFHKSLSEPEIQRIFGNGEALAAPPAKGLAEHVSEQSPAELAATPATPEKDPPSTAPTVPPPPTKAAPVSKSILLARLRARMANDLTKG
jgi:hypothetical protein